MKTIKHKEWEYDLETDQEGLAWQDIKKRKGWVMWDKQDIEEFCSKKSLIKKFNLEDCWFFIKSWHRNFPVARFYADSVGAYLDCDRYPRNSLSGLGVRWKRRIKKSK